MANNLITKNPKQLHYENQLVKITILGGIKIDGLDRMRTTLKIQIKEESTQEELQNLAVRHNLDLYNETQVEKLIRKTARKLEIGSSLIEASLNELIELLEQYRLQEIQKQQVAPARKQLTKTEKEQALTLLKSNNLLEKTNVLIGQSGIIGEEINRLIMYLIMSSRKRDQPLHIISLGASGTGKTHLQENIGKLMPEDELIEITTLSENAFYYFGQQELQHKLILIEDLDGITGALYPLRELQSKKKISKTIAFKNTKGETRTTHITVEGPICVAGCTTKESIYEDNANRSFLIYLDESENQDQKIMEYQRRASAGKINEEEQVQAKQLLQNSQQLLQNIKIINPYAEYLEIPTAVLKKRRTNAHYLQFIELITYYHQHQREEKADPKTGEIYIETTIEDIKNANELIKEILIHKSDILTGNSRNQLENLKEKLKNKDFTNLEVRNILRISKTTAQRYLNQWLDANIITKIKNKEKQTYHYKITNTKDYQQLEKEIDTILNQALTKIKQQVNKK